MSRSATEAHPAESTEAVAARDHSGRLLVRMPKSLHAELARASEREGTSLNAFIVASLSAAVAWRAPDDGRRTPAADSRPGAPPGPRPDLPGGPATAPPPSEPRGLSLALKANLAVLLLATLVAVALLVTAWQG